MTPYEYRAQAELLVWQWKMRKEPSYVNRLAKGIQTKINNFIPEKVHQGVTFAIEKMVKGVLFGAKYTTSKPRHYASLRLREIYAKKEIRIYKKTASLEGAITGAGGFVMGAVDFPAFLAIKMKMLFAIASCYGFDVKEYKERLFILYIFQLAFSSQQGRSAIFDRVAMWDVYSRQLPEKVDEFDWRTFQQEYRDYIDLAKMAQLIPIIGAAVGAVANYQLVQQLGNTSINCYRMRIFNKNKLNSNEDVL